MKKLLCIILAIMCLAVVGCSAPADGDVNVDDEPQVNEENEAATPFERIFGKAELTIELVGGNDEFFAGATAVAEELGVGVKKVSAASAEADGVLAYKPASASFTVPACVYTDKDIAAAENLVVYKHDGGIPAENIFESIINFDGHDTPVRVIGVYAADGEGAAVAERLAGEGKLLIRKSFTEGGEQTVEDFAAEVVGRYYPGMVEAVYVDNAELAMAVYNAFAAAGRTDFKIFCAEITPELRSIMAENKESIPAAAGITDYERGEIAMRLLLDKLAGGSNNAAVDTTAVAYASYMGSGESAPAYYKSWMDELK